MPSSEMLQNVSKTSIGDAKRLQGMCRRSIMIKKDDVLLTPKKCSAHMISKNAENMGMIYFQYRRNVTLTECCCLW